MHSFRRSDESFIELVHDEEKRRGMLERYRTGRKRYFYLVNIFLVLYVIDAILSRALGGFAEGYRMSALPVLMIAILMVCWTELDIKIKVILCIEEMQRKKES